MQKSNRVSALILGVFFSIGLLSFGYMLGNTAITYKEYERTVTVKGLSERGTCQPVRDS